MSVFVLINLAVADGEGTVTFSPILFRRAFEEILEGLAEVILINELKLSRPLVKCEDTVIDLSKNPDLTIEAVL